MDYKEKLEEAKRIYETANADQKYVLESLFQELKEPEDDKIKKALINKIKCLDEEEAKEGYSFYAGDYTADDCIAWIEKQCQVKESNIFQHENKTCKENDDFLTCNVKPKFKVGDWVVQGRNILKIRCVGAEYYCFETVGGYVDNMLVSEIDSLYHLWTIQDANDGDVLVSGEVIFIFNNIHGVWLNCHCSLHKDGSFNDGDYDLMTIRYLDEVYPATKEQCYTLMKAMTDEGWEFDFKTKELKKIKQKSALSKEDENILTAIIYTVRNSGYKHCMGVSDETMLDWLKSLKDRYTWKPSEDKMNAFIDKASEWLYNNYDKYIMAIGSSIYPNYSDLCRDFQNYMKGE